MYFRNIFDYNEKLIDACSLAEFRFIKRIDGLYECIESNNIAIPIGKFINETEIAEYLNSNKKVMVSESGKYDFIINYSLIENN